jgi:hypothetical protein
MTSSDCPSSLKTFTGSSALTYTLIAPVAGCGIGVQNNTTQTLTINLTTHSLTGNAGSTSNVTVLACPTPAGGCPVSIIKADGTSNWDISNPGAAGPTGPQGATGTVGSDLGALITSATPQSVSWNTFTTAVLGTVQRDDGSFTGTANTLTIPAGKSGWYIATTGTCWDTAASPGISQTILNVYVNGALPTGIPYGAQSGPGACSNYSVVLHLAAGQAITSNIYQADVAATALNATAGFLGLAFIN